MPLPSALFSSSHSSLHFRIHSSVPPSIIIGHTLALLQTNAFVLTFSLFGSLYLASFSQVKVSNAISSTLCSIWVLNGLDETYSHWEGPLALASPTIQMLISPGNTLTNIPRNNGQPDIWASHRPVKVTHKTNHRRQHQHLTGIIRNTILGHHLRLTAASPLEQGPGNLCSNLCSRWGACTRIFTKCKQFQWAALSPPYNALVCSHPSTCFIRRLSKTLCLSLFPEPMWESIKGLLFVGAVDEACICEGVHIMWGRKRRAVSHRLGPMTFCSAVLNLNLSAGSF